MKLKLLIIELAESSIKIINFNELKLKITMRTRPFAYFWGNAKSKRIMLIGKLLIFQVLFLGHKVEFPKI